MINLLNVTNGQSPVISSKLLKSPWDAYWINQADMPQRDYGVYHFRKKIFISNHPSSYVIHVSADNRYRLYVNGIAVCSGPARGDLFNWYYETIDISQFLKDGQNTIAAVVWNMGTLAPVGQISNQTAFLIQGNTEKENAINTDTTWKVMRNRAYTPCSLDNETKLNSYVAVGPGDEIDARKYPWGWEKSGYDDSRWKKAQVIVQPSPVGTGTDNRWSVAPRTIPLFDEHQLIRFRFLRRTSNLTADSNFITGKKSLIIPANKKVSILLDQGENIVAYPELIVSGGKGATIRQTYAEGLFDKDGKKGNRNDIENKSIIGIDDIFLPEGGSKRMFRPLWFRSYRYVQLDIQTKDEEVRINDIYSMKTGYPMQMNASFSCNDSSLNEIIRIGWRTATLCAGEVFYDTPYYEQLQYTGDTRIQALISLYGSGDDRLVKKAISDFYHSRTAEGLTQGRYPSNRLQIIPTYSLFWVSMIHDYWMNRKDDAFIKQFIPAMNEVTEWFRSRVDPNKKMLGPLTWWNFVDWNNFRSMGVPDGAANGNSSLITLQYAYTLNQSADILEAFGHIAQAKENRMLAKELGRQTYLLSYNKKKGLIADTPDQNSYCQHTGLWAILSGAVPDNEIKPMMLRLLQDKTIGQITFYYRIYLAEALRKAGMGDLYYSDLSPWRDMLKLGLTTFSETPEPSRSDCHAWSASPNYDFFATICGIRPLKPGFEQVLIQPSLGELKNVKATIPHPSGMVSVNLIRKGKSGIEAELELPKMISGTFVWNGKSYKLHEGLQRVVVNN